MTNGCFVIGDRVKTADDLVLPWSPGAATVTSIAGDGCGDANITVIPDGSSSSWNIPASKLVLLDPSPEPVPAPVPAPGDHELVIPGEEYNPCAGVVCDDVCADGNLYDQICEDGICIRGVLIESNSSACPGYIAPVAKGKIDTMSWEACHTKAGCRTDVAYWGSDVTVVTAFTNTGNAPGEFKIRLTKKAAGGLVGTDSLLGESAFVSVPAGASETVDVVFVMPSVTSLTAVVELIRNV